MHVTECLDVIDLLVDCVEPPAVQVDLGMVTSRLLHAVFPEERLKITGNGIFANSPSAAESAVCLAQTLVLRTPTFRPLIAGSEWLLTHLSRISTAMSRVTPIVLFECYGDRVLQLPLLASERRSVDAFRTAITLELFARAGDPWVIADAYVGFGVPDLDVIMEDAGLVGEVLQEYETDLYGTSFAVSRYADFVDRSYARGIFDDGF
jgi:hypothetical protein